MTLTICPICNQTLVEEGIFLRCPQKTKRYYHAGTSYGTDGNFRIYEEKTITEFSTHKKYMQITVNNYTFSQYENGSDYKISKFILNDKGKVMGDEVIYLYDVTVNYRDFICNPEKVFKLCAMFM